MICPRCNLQDVTPGTGLCILCVTEASPEEERQHLKDLIEKDPFAFMQQAVPPAEPQAHEAVRARLKAALKGDPRTFDAGALIRTWCDSKGHFDEATGELIDGGEAGWKRWYKHRAIEPEVVEIEPDLDAGRILLDSPNVLDLLADHVEEMGLVGERSTIKIIALVMMSRFLVRPDSLAVKGDSSSGKSVVVQMTLKLFPDTAFRDITGGSPHSLARSKESFVNRIIFVREASALERDRGVFVYMMRTLISEGSLRYETVVGNESIVIRKDGPMGLITTSVLPELEHQMETRILSVYTDSSPEQTRNILRAVAKLEQGTATLPDHRAAWHGANMLLADSSHDVTVPFAQAIAEVIEVGDDHIKMRRSISLYTGLIKAHAILHQAHRQRTADGRILAEEADYVAVYALITDVRRRLLEATRRDVRASLNDEKRETLDAIGDGCWQSELESRLGHSQSTVSRRVKALTELNLVSAWSYGKQKWVMPYAEDAACDLPDPSDVFPGEE